jgi:glycosyltransferase involved in cell wall biosynthesis
MEERPVQSREVVGSNPTAAHMQRPTISIVVPTLGRASKLPDLVLNIGENTKMHKWEIVFVLDYDDKASRDVALDLRGDLGNERIAIVCGDGTFPQKTNLGAVASMGEFVLPGADDIWPHEMWLDEILYFFDVSDDIQVVGANDLSPKSGPEHSTMPVLRRSYIASPGASWGETGTVFHEGYHHNFVETEVCDLAISRGVWVYNESAVIEHLHPNWGKRAQDSTDERGWLRNFHQDEKLFEQRSRNWR